MKLNLQVFIIVAMVSHKDSGVLTQGQKITRIWSIGEKSSSTLNNIRTQARIF